MAQIRGKDIHSGYDPLESKAPSPPPNPSIPSLIPLGGLFLAWHYTYVLGNLLQNGAKFIKKLIPGLKNYMRYLDKFRQAVEGSKS